MSIITIDTAALATLVQELAAEGLHGLGMLFLNGRAEGIASLHRKLLQHARPAPSLVHHDDVVGPVAWHHQLPAGQTFLDGRTSRAVESLQEALGHKDRFGGTLAPLFKLASVGNSDTWNNDAGATARSAPRPSLASVVEVLKGALVEDVLPYHSPAWVGRVRAVIAVYQGMEASKLQEQPQTAGDAGERESGRSAPSAKKPANQGGFADKALLGLLVVCAVLSMAGCQVREPGEAAAPRASNIVLYVYTDDETGCQYIGQMNTNAGVTARIAADGKTHMGCKEGTS